MAVNIILYLSILCCLHGGDQEWNLDRFSRAIITGRGFKTESAENFCVEDLKRQSTLRKYI